MLIDALEITVAVLSSSDTCRLPLFFQEQVDIAIFTTVKGLKSSTTLEDIFMFVPCRLFLITVGGVDVKAFP